MKIEGLQKLTLLDYPGFVACTVFSHGCNFRCPFCHNAGLVIGKPTENNRSGEEFWELLDKRKGILEGVVITGGEPLLQSNIERFAESVKKQGYSVKLDTNGSFPGKLRLMIDAGLVDYVAMDIKNSPAKYAETAGVPVDLNAISDSISLLLAGKVHYEFRTTSVKELHTADDFEEIGRRIQGAEQYFIQSYRDSGEIITPGFSSPSDADLEEYLAAAKRFVPQSMLRGVDK